MTLHKNTAPHLPTNAVTLLIGSQWELPSQSHLILERLQLESLDSTFSGTGSKVEKALNPYINSIGN
jgi:hypothetical protein